MSNPIQASLGIDFRYPGVDVDFKGTFQAGDSAILRAQAIDIKLTMSDFLNQLLGTEVGLPEWLSNLQDVHFSLECAVGINSGQFVQFSIFDVDPKATVKILDTTYQFKRLSIALCNDKSEGVLCKIELSVNIGEAAYLFYFKYIFKDGAGTWSLGALAPSSSSGKIVLFNPENPDSFLKTILPSGGLKVDFDFDDVPFPEASLFTDVPPEPEKHLTPALPTGMGKEVAINATLFDALTVESIYLGVDMPETPLVIPVTIAATATVQLGPFSATVKRMGMTTKVSMADNNKGNLGPLQLEFGIKWPDGAGISLETDIISGGGYLDFFKSNDQYSGILYLSIYDKISVTATGILSTKKPDGSPGFSLLIIISGEFPPIQLGYGFTLNGVGGLLGLNRTMSLEGLQDGIRAGSLDSVMFPDDPIREAPRIINDLNTFFPVAEGRTVFGPMGIIAWGTPELIRAEIGLIIELPLPIRIALLGRVSIILPDEHLQIIVLQADFIGAIDFEKGLVSLDASLVDSRLAAFPLSGDAAFRIKWLGEPNFGISLGGFHPTAKPPSGFPVLKRLGLSILKENNPRLRMEAYMAIMANSVQFGARLDFYYKKSPFTVLASLSFDTLIQFVPFSVDAQIAANAAVKIYGKNLSINLALRLVGPQPWVVNGSAQFKVCLVSFEVKFSKTVGKKAPASLPIQFNLISEMKAALSENGNWAAVLPSTNAALFTLRKNDTADDFLVHPLASVTFNQKVAPLNLELDKVGNTKINGEMACKITRINIGSNTITGNALKKELEYFPPAQYFNMTNAEKLARPSFEKYQSGISFSSDPVSSKSPFKHTLEYETIIVDGEETTLEASLTKSTQEKIDYFTRINSLAIAQRKRTNFVRSAGQKVDIQVKPISFVTINIEAKSPIGVKSISFAEAMREKRVNKDMGIDLEVIPAFGGNR